MEWRLCLGRQADDSSRAAVLGADLVAQTFGPVFAVLVDICFGAEVDGRVPCCEKDVLGAKWGLDFCLRRRDLGRESRLAAGIVGCYVVRHRVRW